MRISVLVMALLTLATPVRAQDWQPLNGPAITTALASRVLGYADGSRQDFNPNGETLYDNGRPSRGEWAVRGDQYCSVWPPSDVWACYDVAINGLDVRFNAASGGDTIGRYQDLN